MSDFLKKILEAAVRAEGVEVIAAGEIKASGAEDSAEARAEAQAKERAAHEAQMKRIDAQFERFTRPNPFKVGDWVMPRKGGYLARPGAPHRVVAVDENMPLVPFNGTGGQLEGTRQNVRVLCTASGPMMPADVVAHWVEHTELDYYVPVTDEQTKAS